MQPTLSLHYEMHVEDRLAIENIAQRMLDAGATDVVIVDAFKSLLADCHAPGTPGAIATREWERHSLTDVTVLLKTPNEGPLDAAWFRELFDELDALLAPYRRHFLFRTPLPAEPVSKLAKFRGERVL